MLLLVAWYEQHLCTLIAPLVSLRGGVEQEVVLANSRPTWWAEGMLEYMTTGTGALAS